MTARPPLPAGFRVVLDRRVRVVGGVVVGGEPRRVLRLTARGAELLRRLRAGEPVGDTVAGTLARRLVDAGVAHPRPGGTTEASVTVVVPVLDRVDLLETCLGSLGGSVPVVVADDGSLDAAAVVQVAGRHGASVLRRPVTGGPAAARNAGTAAADSEVLAFVDSDAQVSADAIRRLLTHFADPCVAAVAPRVRPAGAAVGGLGRFAAARSPLDMGAGEGEVDRGRLRYLPSTVLLVRRAALVAVGGFDEALRYGEDVDLAWRLVAAGWSVRYDGGVTVGHAEPRSWRAWLARRLRYGTSAGPLARRHPGRLRGPSLAGLAAPVSVLRAVPRLRAVDLPAREVLAPAAAAPVRTLLGLARWALPLWWPVLVAGLLWRRTRPFAAAAITAPALVEWGQRRPSLDPVSYLVATCCDDIAYGAGVWLGCARARTAEPLLPRLGRPTSSPPTSGP